MAELLQADLLPAETAAGQLRHAKASSGIRYAMLGALAAKHTSPAEIARLTGAVPASIAASLKEVTYAFVPLALSAARLNGDDAAEAAFGSNDRTFVATVATPALVDKAICHRNSTIDGAEFVFLSAELHNDSFALAFEFFINVAHDLVDLAGVPASFGTLLAEQVAAGVKGETSMDAWEHRSHGFGAPPEAAARTRSAAATRTAGPPPDAAKARAEYGSAAFSDAVAVYLLALYLDFDYADLREREYPLLAPAALAARLRAIHALFPPNEGYPFQILYRRRP